MLAAAHLKPLTLAKWFTRAFKGFVLLSEKSEKKSMSIKMKLRTIVGKWSWNELGRTEGYRSEHIFMLERSRKQFIQ